MTTPKSKAGAGRKSLGQLDVSAFLSTLGDSDGEDMDDSFVTARDRSTVKSYKTAPALSSKSAKVRKMSLDSAEENGSEAEEPKSAKKKKAQEKDDQPKSAKKSKEPPLSNKKSKSKDDVAENDMEIEEPKSTKKKSKDTKEVKFSEEEESPKVTSKGSANDSKKFSKSNEPKLANQKKQDKKESKEEKKKASKKQESDDEEQEDIEDDEDELLEHKRELEKLAETDPEFYEHLKKEANELLDFGSDEDDGDDAEGEMEDDDDDEEEEEAVREITLVEIKRLEARAVRGDAVSTRKLMQKFRLGVKSVLLQTKRQKTRKELEAENGEDDNGPVDRTPPVNCPPEVLDRLVTKSLQAISLGLDQALWPGQQQQKKKSGVRLAKHSPHIKAWESKLVQFLATLAAAAKSKDASEHILRHMLNHSRLLAPYFASFEREAKRFLGALVDVWAKVEIQDALRVTCFFRIRQLLVLVTKTELREQVVKDMYVQFARTATAPKSDEARNRMALQARSLAEVLAVDVPGLGYRLGFQHVRQLALHVRAAMASKTIESLQSVVSWRFLQCLRFWSFFVGQHSAKLPDLVFPVVQVGLGVISLVNSPRYAPLRLHCIETIQIVVQPSKVYVPLALPLTEMLSMSDLIDSDRLVASTDTAPDLASLLKLKKDQLKTAATRTILIPRIVTALKTHLETYRFSVAFPELWAPVRASLARNPLCEGIIRPDQEKSNKSGKSFSKRKKQAAADAWKTQGERVMKLLVEQCDEWANDVRRAREGRVAGIKRPGGPSDVEGCEKFSRALQEKSRSVAPQASSSEDLFSISVKEAVDDILADALPKTGKGGNKQQNNKRAKLDLAGDEPVEDSAFVASDEEEQEEKVEQLDPRKFL